jgi:predicted O-methyltransferase YrrM
MLRRALARLKALGSRSVDDPEAFVTGMYEGLMGRRPDPEAMAHYAGRLRSGEDPTAVLQSVLGSEEHLRLKSRLKLLYVEPGHFYSPITLPELAERHLERLGAPGAIDTLPGVHIDRAAMVALWGELSALMRECPYPSDRVGTPYRYQLENQAYGWGDGLTLYAMIRNFAPKRIIEVGSGWSSACIADTVDLYLDGRCELTFIEPYGDLLRSTLGDRLAAATLIESPVQDVELRRFESLEANDILFIDSTHVLKTASDVCFELLEVLPRLKPGVIVHFHDIPWPFEYRRDWAVELNRSWNEAYALRAFLIGNADWEVIFFNSYMAELEWNVLLAGCPDFLRDGGGGGIWLRRR